MGEYFSVFTKTPHQRNLVHPECLAHVLSTPFLPHESRPDFPHSAESPTPRAAAGPQPSLWATSGCWRLTAAFLQHPLGTPVFNKN